MKRLNRKNLIEDFEQLRNGFSQAVLSGLRNEDFIDVLSWSAHYYLANRRIFEMGGEPLQLDWLISYYNEEGKEPSKALQGILDSNQELIEKYEIMHLEPCEKYGHDSVPDLGFDNVVKGDICRICNERF